MPIVSSSVPPELPTVFQMNRDLGLTSDAQMTREIPKEMQVKTHRCGKYILCNYQKVRNQSRC